MLLGRVLGTATATIKHPSMQGWKLLITQPLSADEKTPDGDPLLAIDSLGAGRGDLVVLTSDGPAVRELVKDNTIPVRWSVMGIRD